MRYFIELAYKGTNYSGWQKQPNANSIQETIEEAMSTILQQELTVVGCGRTDRGVHASQYFLHFDIDKKIPSNFLSRINKFLSPDIAFRQIFQVATDAHARFDAVKRSYDYFLHFDKNPFLQDESFYYPYGIEKIDFGKLQAAASILLEFDAFFPFCKTRSDAKTMNCQLTRSEWEWLVPNERLVYHISADRFLRGMVRLIVGMCLEASIGKLSLNEVRIALEKQERLLRNYSVAAEGLFLTEVVY